MPRFKFKIYFTEKIRPGGGKYLNATQIYILRDKPRL